VLRKGTRLGKYRLERILGRGSASAVWRARDLVEKRAVALKIAFPEIVAEWGREAIEREAQVAVGLNHPNIVGIRNADWIDGRFIIATDLAERNLAEYPAVRRSPRIALQVIRDVTSGLAYAHGRKLMHRDVKPENILIFADGRAALGDFGVARFARGTAQAYTEAGTFGYMAPEQAYGRPRLASDVFSLGLIAYEMMSGKLPAWPFSWPPEGYERFQARVPEPLWPVIKKAASFQPSKRYPDAMAMHLALEAAFRSIERSNGRESAPPRRAKRKEPSPLQVDAELFRKRHRHGLALHFDCYRCGGPVAEAMSHCPWCGTRDNSFREVTSYPLVCPDCEKGVRPEWTSCPWCYAGRLEGNGRPPKRDPKAERRCTKHGCTGQLQPFMRYCPVCKQKPRKLWSHPDLSERCPRCRWPVSAESWRYCPWCGRREPRAGTFVSKRR
jgi:serine/threonine protein kinase